MPKFMSLSVKVTIALSAVIFILSIVAITMVYVSGKMVSVELAQTQLNNEAHLIATNIANAFNTVESDVLILSRTATLHHVNANVSASTNNIPNQSSAKWQQGLYRIFFNVLETNPDYLQIQYHKTTEAGQTTSLLRAKRTPTGIKPFNTIETFLHTVSKPNDRKIGHVHHVFSVASTSPSSLRGNTLSSYIEHYQTGQQTHSTLLIVDKMTLPDQLDATKKVFSTLSLQLDLQQYLSHIVKHINPSHNVILEEPDGDQLVFDVTTHRFVLKEKRSQETQSENVLRVTQPIYENYQSNTPIFTLIMTVPIKVATQQNLMFIKKLVMSMAVLMVIAIFLIYFFTKKIMAALTKMTQLISDECTTMDKLSELPIDSNDEVGILARACQKKTQLMHKLAMQDSMTALPNRHAFLVQLEHVLEKAKHNAHRIAVIFMDINKFKFINDKHGHHYGDQLLQRVAERLQKQLEPDDYAARLGGDEFVLAITATESISLEERIQQYYEALNHFSFAVHEKILDITLSFGVAIYPNHANTISDLLKKSDKAMYKAKQSGMGVMIYANDNL